MFKKLMAVVLACGLVAPGALADDVIWFDQEPIGPSLRVNSIHGGEQVLSDTYSWFWITCAGVWVEGTQEVMPPIYYASVMDACYLDANIWAEQFAPEDWWSYPQDGEIVRVCCHVELEVVIWDEVEQQAYQITVSHSSSTLCFFRE